MNKQTFYRRANGTSQQAIKDLEKAYPKAELVSFEVKAADKEEVKLGRGIRAGERIFVATLKSAEFPPSDDDEGDAPADDAPKDDAPPADDGGEDAPADDAAPEFGGDEGGDKPEKLSPEEETNHLLHQLVDIMTRAFPDTAGPEGGDLPPPDLGAEGGLPDIGAPAQGEGLGGPPGAPPLPPPVKPKAPMGAPSFAKFDTRASSVTLSRTGVDKTVFNKTLIAEAAQAYPTHRVSQIKRNDPTLVENKLAIITLVKK